MKTKIYYKRLKFRSIKYNEKTPYFFNNYTILNNKIHNIKIWKLQNRQNYVKQSKIVTKR